MVDESLHRNFKRRKIRVVGQAAQDAGFQVLLGHLALEILIGMLRQAAYFSISSG